MSKTAKTLQDAVRLIEEVGQGWFIVPKTVAERLKAKSVGMKFDNGRHAFEFRIDRKGHFYTFTSRPFNQPKGHAGSYESLAAKSEFTGLWDFIVWAVVFHDVDFEIKNNVTRGRSFEDAFSEYKKMIL